MKTKHELPLHLRTDELLRIVYDELVDLKLQVYYRSYPDPKIYYGESADSWRLDIHSPVLCWDKAAGAWDRCRFSQLEKGDFWMFQPQQPDIQ